jgi:hypothetical protein
LSRQPKLSAGDLGLYRENGVVGNLQIPCPFLPEQCSKQKYLRYFPTTPSSAIKPKSWARSNLKTNNKRAKEMQKAALQELTAISPLDGRYWARVAPLADFFSEYALHKYRVRAPPFRSSPQSRSRNLI